MFDSECTICCVAGSAKCAIHGERPPVGFIACAHFEESIYHFGESDTPEKALADFLGSGAFHDYCGCRSIEEGSHVEVKIFKAIYADSPEANTDDWEDGWQWMLGDEVGVREIQYLCK